MNKKGATASPQTWSLQRRRVRSQAQIQSRTLWAAATLRGHELSLFLCVATVRVGLALRGASGRSQPLLGRQRSYSARARTDYLCAKAIQLLKCASIPGVVHLMYRFEWYSAISSQQIGVGSDIRNPAKCDFLRVHKEIMQSRMSESGFCSSL